MTAEKAFVGFFQRGIQLSVVDGNLNFKAAEGVVTAKDIAVMKELKEDLIDVIMERDERAAIYQYEGNLSRFRAEQLACDDIVKILQTVRTK